ncbi:MAG: Gfo/Idh/MocA family oxidoreductase [Anaerolineae bacterium]|nr:Gfo/Idh/MocA family oxidoreductase [Anaerolineae bacterium]
MAEKIRWGILGTGSIATKFADGLSVLPDAEAAAVGSRTQAGADRFGEQHQIPRRYASYEALANDPDVDVIYIATPHTLHNENTRLCLEAGKAVLCEKPFAINAQEAAGMIALAREKRLFLMEAMWTRYLPVIVHVRRLIADGVIGEVRMLTADFGFRTGFNPEGRLFDPNLGGGALLDVGIYPVSLAYALFGKPAEIKTVAGLGATGIDEQSAYLFGYPSGQLALLSSAVRTSTPHEAIIAGTEGLIRIPDWWHARHFILSKGSETEVVELPFHGNGYNYEAAEVMRCLREGLLESETMPLDETLSIMGTLDAIREQWGLVYPKERG